MKVAKYQLSQLAAAAGWHFTNFTVEGKPLGRRNNLQEAIGYSHEKAISTHAISYVTDNYT
jgi:hypothetical protein